MKETNEFFHPIGGFPIEVPMGDIKFKYHTYQRPGADTLVYLPGTAPDKGAQEHYGNAFDECDYASHEFVVPSSSGGQEVVTITKARRWMMQYLNL